MPPTFGALLASRRVVDAGAGKAGEWEAKDDVSRAIVEALDLDATDPRDEVFTMAQFGREKRDPESGQWGQGRVS
ncbi:HET-domain-containing protein [Zalerion maritima]|uniref:HET-domain-containing protein n=1 Tax=Zalerion maritima TaxID=339359 RepID=A0AAD5WV81_9PEZI|nr:HET-domain-containing protein [Zalerion maritima]